MSSKSSRDPFINIPQPPGKRLFDPVAGQATDRPSKMTKHSQLDLIDSSADDEADHITRSNRSNSQVDESKDDSDENDDEQHHTRSRNSGSEGVDYASEGSRGDYEDYGDYEKGMDEVESESKPKNDMFVKPAPRPGRRDAPSISVGQQRFTMKDWQSFTPETSIAEEGEPFKKVQNLRESRFSGGTTRKIDMNKKPEMVLQKEVSDASLLKRGQIRSHGTHIPKRGYGANDPENIEIVNMREVDQKSFREISQILNERRLKAGKDPKLTGTAVANRYNRTAPLLFAAAGREFVPLGQRGEHSQQRIKWTNDLEVKLVEAYQEWEATKWPDVVRRFREKTGEDADEIAVSTRYNML